MLYKLLQIGQCVSNYHIGAPDLVVGFVPAVKFENVLDEEGFDVQKQNLYRLAFLFHIWNAKIAVDS
jgi:hypothetical protein